MTISALDRIGMADARDLMRRLTVPDPPPFALLRRAGAPDDEVELMTGRIVRLSRVADLPVPDAERSGRTVPQVLAVLPYRQISERGYACHDDGEPILALLVEQRAALPLSEAVELLPDVEVTVAGSGFDIADDEYEKVVERVIDKEIRTGEGSNFVIRRSFSATVERYRPEVAMTIFRRLLISESNAYWTFLVHAGQRTFVGASPEQHVRVAGGRARMNPISGTYRYPSSGARLDDVLRFLADQKEIDELYMVVDEELKMLAGVCEGGARVHGPYLREMARLAHTEYVLEGSSLLDVRDVLRETMFAPTIIGSPLQNACRVIVRHEVGGRGYYGGALALLGRDSAGLATLDSAIMIRTAEVSPSGTLRVDVGATLVRDSRPVGEVAETWTKVEALLAAIGVGDGSGGSSNGGTRPAGTGRPTVPMAANGDVRAALRGRNAGLSTFWLSAAGSGGSGPPTGRALIVDAEDRFTGMLGHQLRAMGYAATVRSLHRLRPADVEQFDVVVLGPGPGDPRDTTDDRVAGLRGLIEYLLPRRIPFVAECLSHQVLSAMLGLPVIRRDRPNQGTQRRIDLFGRSEPVAFYNSFAAVHDTDRISAGRDGGVIELCRDPRTGEVHALRGDGFASVQFHVESVLTRHGADILAGLIGWVTGDPDRPAAIEGARPHGR